MLRLLKDLLVPQSYDEEEIFEKQNKGFERPNQLNCANDTQQGLHYRLYYTCCKIQSKRRNQVRPREKNYYINENTKKQGSKSITICFLA